MFGDEMLGDEDSGEDDEDEPQILDQEGEEDDEIVHVDPDRTPPVVFICAVKLVCLAQTSNAVVAPQLLWVRYQV